MYILLNRVLEKLKHQYDESKPPATVLSVQADTEATELGDENPIVKFNKLKGEIEMKWLTL